MTDSLYNGLHLIKYAVLQRKLYEARDAFLHGSVMGTSLRSLHDCRWMRTGALRDVRSVALRVLGSDAGVPEKLADAITVTDYAACLSRIYSFWKANIPAGRDEAQTLPHCRSYGDWLNAGGHASKYRPVHRLERRLQEHGRSYFLRALLHGSIGTLDDVDGFSDMDLAFVVRDDYLLYKDGLLALRELARDILTLTYSFDPFMHHGPYYLSECDMELYPEGLFPSVLFAHGVELLAPVDPLKIQPYAGEYFIDDLLEYFRNQFAQRAQAESCIKNGWDIEVMLGETMILPALYLQRISGSASYKRDSFAVAENRFLPEFWMPIEVATELRRTLAGRYHPSWVMQWLAHYLKWPGLMQRRGRNRHDQQHRVRAVAQKVDSTYASRTVQLIENMQKEIEQADRDRAGESTRNGAIFDQVFAGLKEGPFSDEPFRATGKDYDGAKGALIEHWLTRAPEPTSIYQLGEIGAPGFSDLDFIIIWPENTPIPYRQFCPAQAPEELRPYLVHAPYFCTPALWKEVHAWYPAFRLKHVWGKEMEAPSVTDDELPGFALGHLINAMAVKIPEDLFLYSLQHPIRVRVVANTLSSIKYVGQLAEKVGLPAQPRIHALSASVQKLRREWFADAEGSLDGLQCLCMEAVLALDALLVDLAVFLEGKVVVTRGDSDPAGRGNKGAIALYAKRCMAAWAATGSTPRFSAPVLSRLLGVYRPLCPELEPALAPFNPEGGMSLNADSVYHPGLIRHVHAMKRYSDTMVPLGVPATKYLSLGYAPELLPRPPRPQPSLRDKVRWRIKRCLQSDLYWQLADHCFKRVGF